MSELPTTITFEPPLPCSSIVAPDRRCGQPATVGMVDPPMGGGAWLLTPFCSECVAKLMAIYQQKAGEE